MDQERGEGSATHADADDSLPWIFLSHSGRQKPFVTKLYHALLHAKHRPFFDKDTIVSLPVGLNYPSRIFQACAACKMGVVVLSEDYVQNLWPMVELQHLRHHGSSHRLIYPLFYNLQPSDLSDPNNLARWEESWVAQAAQWQWEEKMLEVQKYMESCGCEIQISLDTSSWSEILKELNFVSGEVHRKLIYVNDQRTLQDQSEREYIDAVVSHICALIPAPHTLDTAIKGGQRLHQEMVGVFEQDDSLGADGVRRVGVYGIGGSGKSTLCKTMATFYSNEFCGRCYILEFPSNNNEAENLLQNIKAVLPTLTLHSESTVNVCTINQAMYLLKEGLRANKIFLAIDNVWGHSAGGQLSFDYAQEILWTKCKSGSKILVTSRSRDVLANLLRSSLQLNTQESNTMDTEHSMTRTACPRNIVHVPSLTEEEAVQALKLYSCNSYFIPEDCFWRLARSCFFTGQCHPLYLKLKGVELRTKGRPSFNDQTWEDLFSSLEIRGNIARHDDMNYSEAEVLRVVEESLKVLPPHLQDIFIYLATAYWEDEEFLFVPFRWGWSRSELVRYLYDKYYTEDAMFHLILELEYHGLLEIELVETTSKYTTNGAWEKLIIHDLHKSLAHNKVFSGCHSNAIINHAVHGDLSVRLSLEVASKKLLCGHDLKVSTLATLLGSSWTNLLELTCQVQVQIRVLCLCESIKSDRTSGPVKSLNLKGGRTMEALRALVLYRIKGLKEIKGWEGVPNLVRLDLHGLEDLKRIESLGHLKSLETLTICYCTDLQLQALVGDTCRKSGQLVTMDDQLPNLQVLLVLGNYHLEELGSRFTDAFPSLRRLVLKYCFKLERFSDPSKVGRTLRILDLGSAASAERLKSIMEGGISSLTALQYLNLEGCGRLVRTPGSSKFTGLRSFNPLRLSHRGLQSFSSLHLNDEI